MKRADVQMRDPFIYIQGDSYYLYGTTDVNCWKGPFEGFKAFKSGDLENFEPLGLVFTPPENFWGTQNFWAPELHCYKGSYYLFASFKAPQVCRGTSVLKADSPQGPFLPWGEERVTPKNWECLDGTLYVDEMGQPWCVFCHEWVQQGGGTVCAVRLKADLSGPEGEPVILFAAKDAAWVKRCHHSSGAEGYVTDGPNMIKASNGQLWMLWSSVTPTGYGIGLAKSRNGSILGPWALPEEPIFAKDGGHGMVFTDLNGTMRLTIHTPNDTPNERPIFRALRETEEGIELIEEVE